MKNFLTDPFNWLGLFIFAVIVALAILLFQTILTPQAQRDFERRNAFMQICVQSEDYTREECLTLAGKIQ